MSNTTKKKKRAHSGRLKQKVTIARWRLLFLRILALIGLVLLIILIRGCAKQKLATPYTQMPDIDVELLDVNPYSRPGRALQKVNGIVVHYTANPGTDAMANRDYFEGLAQSHATKASSHFIIGLDGKIVQCIPTSEISYASNSRNNDTISIECCHPDDSGKFTEATYQSLIRLTAYLMGRFNLSTDDVIRHYDVTGKNCPKYFVEHPDAWEQFKTDVNDYIKEHGTT